MTDNNKTVSCPRSDVDKIRKAIKAARKRKGKLLASEKELHNRMIKLCKLVVDVQLAKMPTGWGLDLGNDETIAEVLGCSTRQAKTTKVALSDLGVLTVPEKYKQKKKGDYPTWLLSFDFAIFPEGMAKPVCKTSTSDKRNWRDMYKADYHYLVEEAIEEMRYVAAETDGGSRFSNDGSFWAGVRSYLRGAAECEGIEYKDLLA